MFDPVAQIDILGLSTLLGSLMLFAGLAWLLLSNRSLEDLNEIHERERARPGRQTLGEQTLEEPAGPERITVPAGAEALPNPKPQPESEPARPTRVNGPSHSDHPGKPSRPTRPARPRRAA